MSGSFLPVQSAGHADLLNSSLGLRFRFGQDAGNELGKPVKRALRLGANLMIGIIGGMGVYAGTDLVDKVSEMTIAAGDRDYLPVALLSYPDIPDRSAFALGSGDGINPGVIVNELIDKLVILGCTVCGVACNTFHMESIFRHVAERSDILMLNIVDETAAMLGAHQSEVGTVAVLGTQGTVRLGLYETALSAHEVAQVPLPESAIIRVSNAIRDVPGGLKVQALMPSDSAVANVIAGVQDAVASGADTVVLGCTELPFILRSEQARRQLGKIPVSIVDPGILLARALVRSYAPTKLAAGSWRVNI